eukprot:4212774-Amphidinium_carterae.1
MPPRALLKESAWLERESQVASSVLCLKLKLRRHSLRSSCTFQLCSALDGTGSAFACMSRKSFGRTSFGRTSAVTQNHSIQRTVSHKLIQPLRWTEY